jgi:hypothetical protein
MKDTTKLSAIERQQLASLQNDPDPLRRIGQAAMQNASPFTLAPNLKTTWEVSIPKGGEFIIHYKKDLSPWVRFWLKFIGWGVTKGKKL